MRFEAVTKGKDWGGEFRHYFNLSHPVGRGCPNIASDVGFIQFCFMVLSRPKAQIWPEKFKAAISKVRVTRTMDHATQAAIESYQSDRDGNPGARVDGIIHAVPQGASTGFGQSNYAIVKLNLEVCVETLPIWPRLDMHALADPIASDIRDAISPMLNSR